MNAFPPWAVMCCLAGGLWVVAKLGTVLALGEGRPRAGAGRFFGYLVLWPGMNARGFLASRTDVQAPAPAEWTVSVVRIVVGLALVFGLAPRLLDRAPFAAGWTGMFGLVLVLHFGVLDLASLAWRAAGVDAPPLMDAPMRSTSLDELWSRRWNRAFHELAARWCFEPLRRRIGPVGALFGAFLLSGLVHEVVITLPARGGYGGPTLYFLFQGAGIAVQRMPASRRRGWARGARGWLLTLVVALGPVTLLFPEPFVLRVIVPLLRLLNTEFL